MCTHTHAHSFKTLSAPPVVTTNENLQWHNVGIYMHKQKGEFSGTNSKIRNPCWRFDIMLQSSSGQKSKHWQGFWIQSENSLFRLCRNQLRSNYFEFIRAQGKTPPIPTHSHPTPIPTQIYVYTLIRYFQSPHKPLIMWWREQKKSSFYSDHMLCTHVPQWIRQQVYLHWGRRGWVPDTVYALCVSESNSRRSPIVSSVAQSTLQWECICCLG